MSIKLHNKTHNKTHIIIPITDISNLNQYGIIDKTPFYFQPYNKDCCDDKTLLAFPGLQVYKLCVKQDFYNKCAQKSANIFELLDSYFAEIKVVPSTTDMSFNYSMTSRFPVAKYKLVFQALVNWFSIANWWWLVYPHHKTALITLTPTELQVIRDYPQITNKGNESQILMKLCKRIENIIGSSDSEIAKAGQPSTNWTIYFGDPRMENNQCLGIKLPATNNEQIIGLDVVNYLASNKGFRQLYLQEYQGYVDFVLSIQQPANPELCISVFIKSNKLIAISQTNLDSGYSARLEKLINTQAKRIISMLSSKWQELTSRDGGKLDYEDVVLTVELLEASQSQLPSSKNGKGNNNYDYEQDEINELLGIQIWNIEMGYGAWTLTSSKLFTWAELELLTGSPPVIKIISKRS